MTVITLGGRLGPETSYDLDGRLTPATTMVRPQVVVDLSSAEDIHPSVGAVLLYHQRQARRLAGDVHIVAPRTGDAHRLLDQIGLCRFTTVAA